MVIRQSFHPNGRIISCESGSDRFGNFIGMNVKVGFAAKLVTLNLMPVFKFAIH